MNARYYVPSIGRFASADTIVPDPAEPQSFNRYYYGSNNPLRYTDPTGHCGADVVIPNEGGQEYRDERAYESCVELRDALMRIYGVKIVGIWKLSEMALLSDGLGTILVTLSQSGVEDSLGLFKEIFGNATIERQREHGVVDTFLGEDTAVRAFALFKHINIYDGTFLNLDRSMRTRAQVIGTFAHELAHVWDFRQWRGISNWMHSLLTGREGDRSPAPPNQTENAAEDWAYTFEAFVVEPQKLAEERRYFVAHYVWMIGYGNGFTSFERQP